MHYIYREKQYSYSKDAKGKEKDRPQQSSEVLFIERIWNFLKPGGKAAIILPDGILTNSSAQYVRDYIIRILEKKHQQVNGKKLLEQYINYPQIGHHFLAKAFHSACFEQMQGFCKVHYNA